MGGTVGGATTSTPEYLTETQYYSPSEFEDESRRGKSHETVLIGIIIISFKTHLRWWFKHDLATVYGVDLN